MTEKEEWRAKALANRRLRTEDIRKEKDAAICRAFLSSPFYGNASSLCLYYPIKNEIDVLPIAEAALRDGKRVYFPRCDGKTMTYHAAFSLTAWEKDRFGIPCPPKCEDTVPDAPLLLVPALCYDRHGYRLGYGGGYFDRFLAANPFPAFGVTYADDVIGELPRQDHDIPLPYLLTEKGILCATR